jgi:predicted MFS family arabinose efflux permease
MHLTSLRDERLRRPRLPSDLERHPDFLKLWAGQSVSLIGSQVTRLALPLAAVLTLGAGPAAMGLLGAVQLAPYLLLGLFAGVIVDRLRRRPILIAADLGRAALLAVIPALALSGSLRLGHLYLIGFLLGALELFFEVAYMSFLPSLVRREQLPAANSLLQMSDSVAQVAGPGLAGVLVQALTAPIAIFVDALSFLGSAASLLLINAPERRRPASAPGPWRELKDGLRLVFGHPWLRAIAGCTATMNFSANVLMTVYILYATRRLGLTAAVIGAIFAVGGASTVLGTVLATPAATRLGLGRVLILAPLVIGAGSLLIPLAGSSGLVAVALLLGTQVLWGIGRPVFDINQLSLRQSMTSDDAQGRVNATMLFVIWGVIPIGSLLGGILGTSIGLRPTLAVGALGMLLSVVWIALSPVRRLRSLSAEMPGQAAA